MHFFNSFDLAVLVNWPQNFEIEKYYSKNWKKIIGPRIAQVESHVKLSE